MRYRNLLVIALVLFVAAGVAAIIHSANTVHHVSQTPAEGNGSMTAKNVQFTVTQGAQKKWLISAEQAQYSLDRTGAKLVGIKGAVFDDAGKEIVEFLAPEGQYQSQDSHILLSGGVSAHTLAEKDGITVSAPTMEWSTKTKQVLADGGITFENPTFGSSHAARCRFNLDLTNIALEGGVTTEIKPK